MLENKFQKSIIINILLVLFLNFVSAQESVTKGDSVITFGPTYHVKPLILSKGELILPDSLKALNDSAKVLLEFIINEDGKPDSCIVLNSTNNKYNKFSIEYLNSWRFEPAKYKGKPYKVKMHVPLKY